MSTKQSATKSSIFDKAIAYALEIRCPGNKRKVDSKKMKLKEGNGAQPESKMVGVHKSLYDCPEYKAIVAADTKVRLTLGDIALPCPFMRGIFMIPFDLIQQCDQVIANYIELRNKLIDSFLKVYKQAVLDAKEKLGGLFDPNDYPSTESLKEQFSVSGNYLELGVPGFLQKVAPDIFKREKEEFENKLNSAYNEISNALRESFAELVSHMLERLSSDKDGKAKKFKNSTIDNLSEFLSTFNSRNIINDSELQNLVDKSRKLLSGKSADEIRDSDAIREDINKSFTDIKKTLDTLIVDKPSRKFNFDLE